MITSKLCIHYPVISLWTMSTGVMQCLISQWSPRSTLPPLVISRRKCRSLPGRSWTTWYQCLQCTVAHTFSTWSHSTWYASGSIWAQQTLTMSWTRSPKMHTILLSRTRPSVLSKYKSWSTQWLDEQWLPKLLLPSVPSTYKNSSTCSSTKIHLSILIPIQVFWNVRIHSFDLSTALSLILGLCSVLSWRQDGLLDRVWSVTLLYPTIMRTCFSMVNLAQAKVLSLTLSRPL